jgi:hypothetical protein
VHMLRSPYSAGCKLSTKTSICSFSSACFHPSSWLLFSA